MTQSIFSQLLSLLAEARLRRFQITPPDPKSQLTKDFVKNFLGFYAFFSTTSYVSDTYILPRFPRGETPSEKCHTCGCDL
ncbi:hypothetical protein BGZ96_003032 [Linnemannia gamsii]|uniref:Uncharacterized protein n=1 Tax=Linnemannia gamsii TaxID=64522 RepID=A0ABQ7JK14_9FUNG|nr:hypothetical protein BGZ96_003032 [Linnemannia gamsii]